MGVYELGEVENEKDREPLCDGGRGILLDIGDSEREIYVEAHTLARRGCENILTGLRQRLRADPPARPPTHIIKECYNAAYIEIFGAYLLGKGIEFDIDAAELASL